MRSVGFFRTLMVQLRNNKRQEGKGHEGKQAEKFVVSKDGGDGEPIDALSGATITSRSVTGAVNAALGYYQAAFQ